MLSNMTTRDPQRRYSEADRRIVRDNQNGRCAGPCGGELPDDFEMHHRVAWSAGGPTTIGNARGLCRPCHLIAPKEDFDSLKPRAWQAEALEEALPRLRAGLTATIAAAPGAGKTLFSGFTIQALVESGTIERVVVFVPNNVLKGQWARDLKQLGIHVDPDAGRHVVENADSGFVGVVHTYQILTQGALVTNALIRRADHTRTLYIFDEVHHLAEAEHSAWGQAVGVLVGTDPDHPRHPVLNLSGTLFRSRIAQKIGTVRYEPVPDQPNKVQAVADYAVYTDKLIAAEQLRHVSLWQFDSTLEIVNLRAETVVTSDIIDLSEQTPAVRSEALRTTLRDNGYLRPLLTDMKGKLFEQHDLLDGHPVKALVVCDTQDHARQVHSLLGDIMGRAPFLAVSEDGPNAAKAIHEFRSINKMAVLVTVRMVTEGFDCPDITTLVHLTPWRAPLFINQMVARSMRITDTERRLGIIIPAAVLIPRDTQIRDAYNRVLVHTMHVLELPTVCAKCGQMPCICRSLGGGGGGDRDDILVHVLGTAELAGISHDGDEIDMVSFDPFSDLLTRRGVPHVYHPAFAAVYAEAGARPADAPRSGATERGATLREQMFGHLELIDRAAAWWVHNGASPVAQFQGEINDHMGIDNGDRHWATLDQLTRGVHYARHRVRTRCETLDTAAPAWARGAE